MLKPVVSPVFSRVRLRSSERLRLLALGGLGWLLAGAAPAQETGVATPPREEPPAQTQPAEQLAAADFWVRVTGDRVYLRSRPDTNSTPVGQVDRDFVLRADGREGDWLRCLPPEGVYSLVAAEFIERESETRGKVNVEAGVLRVRVGSTVTNIDPLSADVIARLERGTMVEILGNYGPDWLRIVPPADVRVFVSSQFAEPIDDATAARLRAGGTTTVTAGDSGASPATTQPAATQPGGIGGPWGERLAAVEQRIAGEVGKPLAERDWAPLVADLRPIAEQRESAAAAQRASAWIAQLEKRIAGQKALVEARQIAARQSQGQQRHEQEMQDIERARSEPTTRPGFDARGQLLPTFALEAGEFGLRYKLQDPLSGRVDAYVEFPPQTGIDVSKCLNKYVGVRGTRYLDEKHEVYVIRVEAITVLSGTPETRRQPPRERR